MALAFSCVDELPLPRNKSAPRLVVDGLITQEDGPHYVNLLMTDSTLSGELFPVLDAKLAIINNRIKIDSLFNIGNGRYQTNLNYRGEIGRFYKLIIRLKDGRQYESEEQELIDSGSIDSLKVAYIKDYNSSQPSYVPSDVFQITIDAKPVSQNQNKLRWRWRGTYEVATNPEQYTISIDGAEIVSPLPCSGFLTNEPCTCCTCWVIEESKQALVPNLSIATSTFNKEIITNIPVDAYRFLIRYHIEVEQLSLSDEVFEFWKRIKAQQAGANDIFQPNAIRLPGNIRSLDNDKEEVLGIFSVSGITRVRRFISPVEIRGIPPIPSIIKNDCREGFSNSTTNRPEFW